MKHRSFLIKPASSLCNMSCKYCFYYDVANNRENFSYGIMDKETTKALVKKSLAKEATTINYAFQGGEPTMAGLSYFKEFTKLVDTYKNKDQVITYAIQTNGYCVDQEWISFFKEYHFLVGVSLDGYQENHDNYRFNQKHQPTYQRIIKTITLLKENHVEYNILTVLTSALAKEPERLYQFYKENQFSHIQLIPCLPELEETNINEHALTPKLFASFYNTFYKLWHQEYQKGNYLSVTLFDNVIPMFKGIAPQLCGMLGFCQPQFVVESDGSVYPCDFYATDKYCLGNINQNTIKELSKSKVLQTFLVEPKRECSSCKECMFISLCKGNCKRMNVVYFDDNGYCGYQEFLNNHYQSMYEIAKTLK